jgi:hypothetical protein
MNRSQNRALAGGLCQVAGVIGIVTALYLGGNLLVHLPRDWPKPQRITCVNNLKQIGLSFRLWALDHGDHFTFNVSTNSGGTREECAVTGDGTDRNAYKHFQAMSNDLTTPLLLVCPQDSSRKPGAHFPGLQPSNVTYQLRSGAELEPKNSEATLATCPVHGNILRCDGSVREVKKQTEARRFALLDLLRYHEESRLAFFRALTVLTTGAALLFVGILIRPTSRHQHDAL